jgi:erythronate-4-phosphate dehydrogenase
MADSKFFSRIKRGIIFINASRGEVLCDDALLTKRGELAALILDVWNGEPGAISQELIDAADIATPHIAGYSYEGKINGTAMSVQAFARHFGIKELYDFIPGHTPVPRLELRDADGGFLPTPEVASRLLSAFPIHELDKALRGNPSSFEKIRGEYQYRREFVWR